MTCIEYLDKITRNGMKCKFSNKVFNQETTEQALEVNDQGQPLHKVTVIRYKSESISEAKREEKFLEQITTIAISTPSDNAAVKRFYNVCMNIVPKDFRNGEYDYSTWLEWLSNFIQVGIGPALLKMSMEERHLVGGRQMWQILCKRLEVFSQKATAILEKTEEGNLAINFTGWTNA